MGRFLANQASKVSCSISISRSNHQIALANTFAAQYAAQFNPVGGAAGSGGSSGLGGGGASDGGGAVDSDDDDHDDEDGWATTVGIWYGKLTEEQPIDTAMVRYDIVLPVTSFAGSRKNDLVHFNAPSADETSFHKLPALPATGALRFTFSLDARAATGDTISITEIKMKRVTAAPAPAPAPARHLHPNPHLHQLQLPHCRAQVSDAGCATLSAALDSGMLPALEGILLHGAPASAAAKESVRVGRAGLMARQGVAW